MTAIPEALYCDNWIAENGLRFLRGFSKTRPWHLVVNFSGPHNPMDVTPGMACGWSDTGFPMPHQPATTSFTPEDHLRRRRHYAAMIENIDHQVGRFLDLVRSRGEEENTLVVFSSDHGEMLGDHGKWGKSIWRDPALRIPLIVAGPGIQGGIVSEALVMLHDLAATFLEKAGACGFADGDAISLNHVLAHPAASHREVVVSQLGNWRAIQDGRYKAVFEDGAPPQLFDLTSDPHENNNISATSPQIIERLLLRSSQ